MLKFEKTWKTTESETMIEVGIEVANAQPGDKVVAKMVEELNRDLPNLDETRLSVWETEAGAPRISFYLHLPKENPPEGYIQVPGETPIPGYRISP